MNYLVQYTARNGAEGAALVDVRELRALRETIADSVRERGISRRTADELVAPLVRAELTKAEHALHEEAWNA